VLTNNVTRSRLVSLAVSALSIAIAAGIVSAEETDVTTEQNQNVIATRPQPPISNTDSRNAEAYELQMPRLLLQTDSDGAVERSPRRIDQGDGERTAITSVRRHALAASRSAQFQPGQLSKIRSYVATQALGGAWLPVIFLTSRGSCVSGKARGGGEANSSMTGRFRKKPIRLTPCGLSVGSVPAVCWSRRSGTAAPARRQRLVARVRSQSRRVSCE
jgi:hypothetical protein